MFAARATVATFRPPPPSRSFPDDPASSDAAAARPPTLLDRKMLSQNIYNVGPEDLGRLVQLLDQRCEACIKKVDAEDIEVRAAAS